MRSMTGFGVASATEGGLHLRAEVRSVNHKYLQLKVRLPAELSFLEPEVEALVRKRFDRGSMSLSVSLPGPVGLTTVAVDPQAARRYKRALEKLSQELKLTGEITLETVVSMPGVIGGDVDDRALKRSRKPVLAVVGRALDSLEEMREAEGTALRRELGRHARAIEKEARVIARRMPAVVRGHQEALTRRVNELLAGRSSNAHKTVAPEDLAREIALLADRMDVSEELARLASHGAQLETFLGREGPVGRQLEFLVQELLREANTIGSKCNDARVAHAVVELKTSIERLREQVMNVE